MKFCEVFSVNQVMTLGGPALAGDPKLLSIDRVIASAREKAELHRTTGADAVEMEAAAIAERAESWKVPFRAIRVVSDSAEESLPLDFNRMRDADGRFSRARIVGAALRHPSVFPRLLRLDQRSKLAAEALGDFIADTRF
jgi:hypothetical protein